MGPAALIAVNYRSGSHLGGLLEALRADASGPRRVFVVDNASGDTSADPARRWAADAPRWMHFVHSDTNLGLAGGVNLVLDEVAEPYVAIVNPDVIPQPGWLAALTAFLSDHPEVAAASPLITVSGGGEINSAGQRLHVSGLGFNRLSGRAIADAPRQPHRVAGLHGAAFVMRTAVLRSFGGWDETGFLYHEDVALSWTIRLAGHDIWCVPAARLAHDYHLTMSPEKFYLLERNRRALVRAALLRRTRRRYAPVFAGVDGLMKLFAFRRGAAFEEARKAAHQWVEDHRPAIESWSARLDHVRQIDDGELLRQMEWTMPLDQLRRVGAERDGPSREPPGGLPVERG